MNVQHNSDPPFQWAAPGCSTGIKRGTFRPQKGVPSTLWGVRDKQRTLQHQRLCDHRAPEFGRTLPTPQQRRRALTTAAQQSSGLPSEWTDSAGQRYSVAQRSSLRPALTSFLCSRPTCGLLVTTRLGPITEAFCASLGAAKVYRLSVSVLRCVRIHKRMNKILIISKIYIFWSQTTETKGDNMVLQVGGWV
jgi:hypothetical protein